MRSLNLGQERSHEFQILTGMENYHRRGTPRGLNAFSPRGVLLVTVLGQEP